MPPKAVGPITKEEHLRRIAQSQRDKARNQANRKVPPPGLPPTRTKMKPPPPPALPLTKKARGDVVRKIGPGGDTVTTMLRTLMLPGETQPLRFPTEKPEYTSVHKFRQMVPLKSAVSTFDNKYIMFRDPCFPIWATNTDVPATPTASRYIQLKRSELSYISPLTLPSTQGGTAPLTFTHSEFFNFGSAGTHANVFQNVVPGTSNKDPGSVWFYVPAGMRPSLTLNTKNGDCTGGNWNALLHQSEDSFTEDASATWIDLQTAGYFLNSSNAVSLNGGWFKWSVVQCLNPPTTQFTSTNGYVLNAYFGWCTNGHLLSPSAGAGGYTVVEPITGLGRPEFSNAPTLYEKCRVTASSLLLTNVSPTLTVEGSLRAYQIRSAGKSLWGSSIANESGLASRLQWSGKARNGIYAFSTWQMSENAFRDTAHLCMNEDRSVGIHFPFFLLDEHCWSLHIHIGNETNTQSFIATYDSHIEAVTDSQLWSLGLSPYSLEDGRRCQTATMQIQPFTENPIHIPTLLRSALAMAHRLLKANANWVGPLAHNAINALLA